MLVHEAAARHPGEVQVVVENFGASELAERYGIERYPAIFVDEILVAKPKDFGFAGQGGSQGPGRYTPFRAPESRARFLRDMERLLERALAGRLTVADGVAPDADEGEAALRGLPEFEVADLDGTPVRASELRGGVTVVDFWATWCPPCLRALPGLAELAALHPAVSFLAVAVESEPEAVRRTADALALPFPVVSSSPELLTAFGEVLAVPTLYVFDRGGALVRAVHGAPPDLHAELGRVLDELAEH